MYCGKCLRCSEYVGNGYESYSHKVLYNTSDKMSKNFSKNRYLLMCKVLWFFRTNSSGMVWNDVILTFHRDLGCDHNSEQQIRASHWIPVLASIESDVKFRAIDVRKTFSCLRDESHRRT